jgi:hypothetical protein
MNKRNLVLTVLLVLQLAAIVLATRRTEPEVKASRGPLIEGVKAEDIDRVTVASKDETVTIAKSGGAWAVESQGGYPADGKKIDEALRELVAVEVADVVSSTKLHHTELGVADEGASKTITVHTAAGDAILHFGESGRAGTTHARRAGSDEVLAVRGFSTWRFGSRADAWVNRTVVEVEAKDIRAIRITKGADTLVVERVEEPDGDSAAEPEDSFFVTAGADRAVGLEKPVDDLLRRAGRVSLSKVVGSGESGSPLAQVEITTEDSTVSYTIESVPGETERWLLKKAGSAHVVEVGKWAVQPVLDASFVSLTTEQPKVAPAKPGE